MSEIYALFLRQIVSYQQVLNQKISDFATLASEGNVWAYLVVLGIAFAYGAIHALGPGHAKALIASYIFAKGGGAKEAAKMGFAVAAVHAFSALMLTFGIFFLMESFSKNFAQSSSFLQKSSAVMIILVGVYLLYETFLKKEEEIEGGVEDGVKGGVRSKKSDLFAIFAAGIVPCPGVMTISLFSLTLGSYALAAASAIFMSLGMGLSVSLSAVLAGYLRTKSGAVFGKISSNGKIFAAIGACFVIALGVFLFETSFLAQTPKRPF